MIYYKDLDIHDKINLKAYCKQRQPNKFNFKFYKSMLKESICSLILSSSTSLEFQNCKLTDYYEEKYPTIRPYDKLPF